MKQLLKQSCAKVSKRKRKKLTEQEYANLQKRSKNILTRGISELPARPERPSGERGRQAQSEAQHLWDRLYEHEYAVLLFAYSAEVPFTNNRAERDLRMGKVKQKVSRSFRKEQAYRKYKEARPIPATTMLRTEVPQARLHVQDKGNLSGGPQWNDWHQSGRQSFQQ